MEERLNLDVEVVAEMKDHMAAAGFEQHDIDRLAGSDGPDLWKQILRLVTGEEELEPNYFLASSDDGNGDYILARCGKELTLDGHRLVLVRCCDVAQTYGALKKRYKPEDHPPVSVLNVLRENPQMVPAAWRCGPYGADKWVTFLSTANPDGNVSGVYAASDQHLSMNEWWHGGDRDGFGGNEYVVLIGLSIADDQAEAA